MLRFCAAVPWVLFVRPPLPLHLHPNTLNIIIISSISIWLCQSFKLTHPIDISTISTDLYLGHFSLPMRLDTDEDGRPRLLESRNLWTVLFQAKTDLACKQALPTPSMPGDCGANKTL